MIINIQILKIFKYTINGILNFKKIKTYKNSDIINYNIYLI